jgi:phage-related baseplate assembly protein
MGAAVSARFGVIDLATIPNFDLDVIPNEAVILSDRMDKLKEIWASYDPPFAAQYDVGEIEFDPIRINQELNTFFEINARASLNAWGKAVSLAMAWGQNLDAIASRYPGGVPRVESEVYELTDPLADRRVKDDRYRRRIWLAANAFTTAGAAEAYQFWALTAAPELRDVSMSLIRDVYNDTVVVTCMAEGSEPRPSTETLLKVRTKLMQRDIAPMTDVLAVVGAGVMSTSWDIAYWLAPNVPQDVIEPQIKARLEAYRQNQRWLGLDSQRDVIGSAAAVPGVTKVTVRQPADDIVVSPQQTVLVTDITVKFMGRYE